MTDSYSIISYPGAQLPDTYRGLVFSRWMRSLRYGNDYFRLMQAESFYRSYQAFIERLLATASVRIAVLSDDPDVVLGFSVARGAVLDYVHVHKDQRRSGIARKLLPPVVDTITHLTRTGLTVWGGKFPDWQFDPFA